MARYKTYFGVNNLVITLRGEANDWVISATLHCHLNSILKILHPELMCEIVGVLP